MTPPLIVRVAGLPAHAVEPFSHASLLERLAQGERLRERLAETRATLVDCLHGAIRVAAREERGFLLSVKRSCFNAGNLREFRQHPRWPLLASIASRLVEEIVALEEAVEEFETRLDELYGRALRQEQEEVIRLLGSQAFRRGVALSSPDVGQNLDRLTRCEQDRFGRREKKLCLTLLRYASRAALKLSPFSTFTRTGIVLATDDAATDFAFLPGDTWRERSTVSLRRELLEQCSSLLLRCPTFTEGLRVAINETLARQDDECTFFRPGRWEFDDESKAFRYCDPSSVKVSLEGPLVPWLVAELHEEPRMYRHLVERARTAFDAEDHELIVQGITELVGIGFLTFVLPWSFSEPDLEHRILDHLDARPDAGLDDFRNRLGELTGLFDSYAEAVAPAQHLGHARRGAESLFQALAPSAGIDPQVEFKAYDRTLEENVFLLPAPDRTGTHEIAHLSRSRIDRLLEDLDPLARLINLQNSAHDLLQTLAAFGDRRWHGAREVGLLDFFGAAQPLFHEYLRYRASHIARPAPLAPGFNPLELESVGNLRRWREHAGKGLRNCFHDAGSVQRLCSRALGALLDQIPAAPARSCAFCAFVQPLDPEGNTWILNSVNEGFGRLGSRFTSGMDEDTRAYWTASFTPFSFLDLDGEQVELIDMACPGSRTINVHVQQTCRVLKMPGEPFSVAPERLLHLGDLRVRLRGAESPPVLTDSAGRRLLPVPLGSLAAGGRPTLLKFLALFGPTELRQPLPTKAPRAEDGVQVLDRHLVGEIVYTRKKWKLEPRQLLSALEGRSEVAAYAILNRWRLGRGIPDRVFVQEPILLTGSVYRQKPQYIDFSSPSFIQILRSILKVGMRTLTLEEALPVPEQFPARGPRWAAEVQLESFVFRHESLPLVAYERKQPQPARQA